jgi:hypothetical protein
MRPVLPTRIAIEETPMAKVLKLVPKERTPSLPEILLASEIMTGPQWTSPEEVRRIIASVHPQRRSR